MASETRKARNRRILARTIIRTGTAILNIDGTESEFTLQDFEAIEELVLFPLVLNRCEISGWSISCPRILEEQRNMFWFGQQAGGKVIVEDPHQWIEDWRNRNNEPA